MGRLLGMVRCFVRGCDMRLVQSGYDRADRRHQWRCASCGYRQATAVGHLRLDGDTGRFAP